MRDGPGRRALKAVARVRYALDLGATRALRRARGERPYGLGGECRRCARCCEAPGIQVGRLTWYLPLLRRAFLFWQRAVNGFELTGRDREARVFVFRCTHFDPAARSCDSYDSRPGMCRDYPRALLWQPRPEMLPGCGYRPVVWNAGGWSQALERAELTEEQREKLRRGLFLDR
ncbi:MAG TPA: YkgJ family cysteine cluster protein [Vicinamibacteria bacterium]